MSPTKYSLFFSIIFLSSCIVDSDSTLPSSEKVYKYDGSIQCGSIGTDLSIMELELITAGIDVLCAQKGHDGLVRITLCGNDTGNINIYSINKSNLIDAETIGFLSVSNLSEYQDQHCN